MPQRSRGKFPSCSTRAASAGCCCYLTTSVGGVSALLSCCSFHNFETLICDAVIYYCVVIIMMIVNTLAKVRTWQSWLVFWVSDSLWCTRTALIGVSLDWPGCLFLESFFLFLFLNRFGSTTEEKVRGGAVGVDSERCACHPRSFRGLGNKENWRQVRKRYGVGSQRSRGECCADVS